MAELPRTQGVSQARSDSAAAAPNPRPVRCVVMCQSSRPPEALLESFRSRGVELSLEVEPILALSALGRWIVEHRQRTARLAGFHAKPEVDSDARHPSLILVLVQPTADDQTDELLACVARSMPQVTVSTFGGSPPMLRVLQRGRVSAPAPTAPSVEPPSPRRAPTRGLRLAAQEVPSMYSPAPASWLGDDEESSDSPAAQHADATESLISQAELAMLLGDDYDAADDAEQGERAP